jgi:hypothetical protein
MPPHFTGLVKPEGAVKDVMSILNKASVTTGPAGALFLVLELNSGCRKMESSPAVRPCSHCSAYSLFETDITRMWNKSVFLEYTRSDPKHS